ncbi:MAG TPA: type II toxin-antitoxin system RelE/ParE family toxin [Caulobacteraceae bacterium]|jgi:plasmid stabilization system protein ParE
MTHRVVFDISAEDDLVDVGAWIAENASIVVATRYVERLTAYCRRLDVFPKRGTARDDIFPGLRTIGFERRALIAFAVSEETVTILRILSGGQDVEAALRDLG